MLGITYFYSLHDIYETINYVIKTYLQCIYIIKICKRFGSMISMFALFPNLKRECFKLELILYP